MNETWAEIFDRLVLAALIAEAKCDFLAAARADEAVEILCRVAYAKS